MTPARCASQISKLISNLSKSGEQLPEAWNPDQLVSLIRVYQQLCATIIAQAPTAKIPEPEIEDGATDMQEGRTGAYEEMCARAINENDHFKKMK